MLIGNGQVLISILLGDKLNTGKIEFGLAGGLTLSDIGGLKEAKTLSGFNLGFYFDIKTKDTAWMINTGVIVKSPLGAEGLPVYSLNDPTLDTAFKNGTVTTKLRYFNVPVMMKYQFKNNIFLKGGIQLGLRSKAFDEFENTVIDKNDLTYKRKRKDEYHPLDAGLAFGMGYRLLGGNGMNLEIQYYYGIVDVVIDDVSPKQFNRAFYINVGIPIGKGKAQKKANEKS
jgi:hypothetical protein